MIVLALILTCSCSQKKDNSQGENFSNNVNKVFENIVDDSDQLQFFNQPKKPIKPKFEQFPTGYVKPKGWILEIMQQDLEQGVVGALGELYPGIKSDDLYNTARRGGMEDIPEMGDLVLTGAEWEKSIMWWNAETIGNWWDGYLRHAFLTNNQKAISRSKAIIKNLIASQDEDGYIGIYKPNLRYQHEGSNGELWAQTTAFRTMLAYYEFTSDESVVEAVEKGMQVTMKNYGEKSKNPFYLKNAFGGVTHGLMLTDVCETLFRITKNQIYQDYATYLYKAFSTYSINRSFNDLRYPYLKEKDSLFEGHAVHTYEHIRTMANAYYNTGYKELEEAYKNMLAKLEPCILPSGAGHGNEWIRKLTADPNHTASEFCSMLELRNSYGSLIQKTGDISFADAAEKLTYNAMLGARNKNGSAITYSKNDNTFILDGHHHEDGKKTKDPRYKYSPTHSEPAVCCVPNYGRNFTYFLDQMWMKKEDGIVAVMYGPSELTTTVENTKISIEQITNYPLSDEVTFKIKAEKPVNFKLYIRKPNWSESVQGDKEFDNFSEGFYAISKEWKNGETFTIKFHNKTEEKRAFNDEVYLQRGPIVYAFGIPHLEKTVKNYKEGNYTDYYCLPKNDEYKNLSLSKDSKFKLTKTSNMNSFYDSEWNLTGSLFNSSKNTNEKVELVPLGKTVLRRTTFPKQ